MHKPTRLRTRYVDQHGRTRVANDYASLRCEVLDERTYWVRVDELIACRKAMKRLSRNTQHALTAYKRWRLMLAIYDRAVRMHLVRLPGGVELRATPAVIAEWRQSGVEVEIIMRDDRRGMHGIPKRFASLAVVDAQTDRSRGHRSILCPPHGGLRWPPAPEPHEFIPLVRD